MRTILVLEPHAELRRFITVLLMRAGHRGLPAENVAKATALLAMTRVDLVATDLVLCPRARAEPLARWRREQPAVEIVALSKGTQSHGYLRLAAVLGAAWALTRPYLSEGLVELTRPGREETVRGESDSRRLRRGMIFPRGGGG